MLDIAKINNEKQVEISKKVAKAYKTGKHEQSDAHVIEILKVLVRIEVLIKLDEYFIILNWNILKKKWNGRKIIEIRSQFKIEVVYSPLLL